MNKWERLQAAFDDEEADRAPISLWRHHHLQDRTAEGLARATLDLYRRYDLDLIKVTPGGLYGIEDWGADIHYYDSDLKAPRVRAPAVSSAKGWTSLKVLSPQEGALGRELRALAMIGGELDGQAPYLMTVFSPLTTAYKLATERVIKDLRESPAQLHRGLEIITEVTAEFARRALAAGASGIFFATQLASPSFVSQAEYQEFGTAYDLAVLKDVRSPLTVLHIHGEDIYFQALSRYPVNALSWHDHRTSPSLNQALKETSKALMAGLDQITLGEGTVEDVTREALAAIAQTGSRRLILAPSCMIPPGAPEENLQAARDAVGA